MAPVATHTMTEPTAPASLKLRGPSPPDAESVARNQLPGPLSNLGLIEKYPVRLLVPTHKATMLTLLAL